LNITKDSAACSCLNASSTFTSISAPNNGYGGNYSINDLIRLNLLKWGGVRRFITLPEVMSRIWMGDNGRGCDGKWTRTSRTEI
jgi:hypothetical protein